LKLSVVKAKDFALALYGVAWAVTLLSVYLIGPRYFEGVVAFGGVGYAAMNFASLFFPDLTMEEMALALFA
jgi:hypothetical protein